MGIRNEGLSYIRDRYSDLFKLFQVQDNLLVCFRELAEKLLNHGNGHTCVVGLYKNKTLMEENFTTQCYNVSEDPTNDLMGLIQKRL